MINVSFPESLRADLDPVLEALVVEKIASRIAAKDSSVWGPEAQPEASIRLGWVESAEVSRGILPALIDLVSDFSDKGLNRVVLCGMGGSSLAPEVICKKYGVKLHVLDSTDPEQVRRTVFNDLEHTVVVVSSKSGSTVETDSQKRIFEKAFQDSGINPVDRIVIVTDPGSPMEKAAKEVGYRIFNADPNVGGRYSALTAFGLVPSALAGVPVSDLLNEAQSVTELLSSDSKDNPALILGSLMARVPFGAGFKDKVGIISDQSLPDFADWAEQLIAESTGKHERGILPVVLKADSFEIEDTPADMLLVKVAEADQGTLSAVQVSGSLAEQFLLWEFATAIASKLIEVNPFDQPDVESAKVAARALLEKSQEAVKPASTLDGFGVTALNLDASDAASLKDLLGRVLNLVEDDSYLAVHAYLNREAGLPSQQLQDILARLSARPVTFGWGPRFLHSTGQYHKGGPRKGVFLQLVTTGQEELLVPGRDFSFNQLIASQAAGDAKVLADLGRPVLTLTLENSITDFQRLIDELKGMN